MNIDIVSDKLYKENTPSSFYDNDSGVSQLRTTVVVFLGTARQSQKAAQYKLPRTTMCCLSDDLFL